MQRLAKVTGGLLMTASVGLLPPVHAGDLSLLEAQAGPYGVGFRVETRSDRARPYRLDVDPADQRRARPIRMFVWYPVARVEAPAAASFADYFHDEVDPSAGEPVTATVRESVVERLRALELEGAALNLAVDRLLRAPSRARRDAEPAAGRFPLIVIGPGGTTRGALHALLAEHLASHGFVSVAIPSLPVREGERWPFDQKGVDLHLRDMEAALDRLLAWPTVDPGRVGLVGWSVGGVAQALMQMRNPDIDALVSVDGATGYAYGLRMLREALDFDERGVTVPYLHAHGLAPARYEVEKDFTVFETLSTGPALLLTFPDLAHSDFMSRGLLERWAADPEGAEPVVRAYGVLIEAVRRFLEASFTDASTAAGALSAWLDQPDVRAVVSARSKPAPSPQRVDRD